MFLPILLINFFMTSKLVSASTKVGQTDLTIPGLCFGATALGGMPDTYGYDVSEEQARETLFAILQGPVGFLDTSRNYGFGRSEERIGRALKALGGLPQGFVISTKLDRDMETNRFDGERARESLEQSMNALGLDRLQLVHLHDPEYAQELEQVTGRNGALEALFRMKEEGTVEAVGLAAGKVDVMMPILREWDFDAMITHNRYTLINRNADSMIDLARSMGITVLNAAPYASGVLAKGTGLSRRLTYMEATDEMLEPVRALENVCERHGVPLGAAALQFSTREERIASTICGISRKEQIQQTLDWADYEIPLEAWDELRAIAANPEDP